MELLSADADPEALRAWCAAQLPGWAPVKPITAAELLAASEEIAAAAFGLEKFGHKRKLQMLLQPSVTAARAATAIVVSSSAAAGPSSSSAAGPSSSAAGPSASSSAAADEDEDVEETGGVDPDLAERQLHAESHALGNVKWVAEKLHSHLSSGGNAAWAASGVKVAKLGELQKLRTRCELPGVSIVVVGNTGAGKSTLLNALLGESTVLPTNGMRACTACLITMAHDDVPENDTSAPLYRGEVEFLSQAEWAKELDDLLDDLTATDGPNEGRVSLSVQENSPSYGSWCKLYAVYGEAFTHSRERTDEFGPGNRRIYKEPTLPSLKAKLTSTRVITSALGSTRPVKADEPLAFRRSLERYMDSTNELTGGCYWPIVKRVRLFSRKWATLRTGAVLVDAPGVHDDNSARDAVVKAMLKEADAVWIVSNIVRAVNDKTAKDMLGEQFRRQLLMDGQFGSLAFVATHSDQINTREAKRAFAHLPPDATPAQCANARNRYTRRRLRRDFGAGLRELAEQAGDEISAEEVASRSRLPVFTVSSVEYQKLSGLRPHDGPPRVWSDLEQTHIPRLVRHVQKTALARRQLLSLRRVEAVAAFGTSVLSLLQHEHSLPLPVRTAAKQAFDAQAAALRTKLRAATGAAEAKIKAAFDAQVAPQLKAGAADAQSGALSTAEAWGISNREGGLHWATYKATCRRNGVFRINMNEELVAPILRSVSTHWERAFLSGLTATLDSLQSDVEGMLSTFHTGLLSALAAANVPDSASSGLEGASSEGLLGSLRASVSAVKDAAQQQQKELSRALEPLVSAQMASGYSLAYAEAGTGSHRRRVAILEGHVRKTSPKMFSSAADGIVGKLDELRSSIASKLEADVVSSAIASIATSYTPLWDEVGEEARAVRRKLTPTLTEVMLEAHSAVRKLKQSFREAAASGAGRAAAAAAAAASTQGPAEEEEEDVMDVTEEAMRAKRARQQEMTIDLDDEEAEGGDGARAENYPPQEGRARPAQRAKLEQPEQGATSAEAFVPKGE